MRETRTGTTATATRRAVRARLGRPLVCYPDDVRYLTGARGTLTWVLLSPHDAVLVAHFVDLEQTRLEVPQLPVQRMEQGGKNEVAAIAQDWRAKTVPLSRAHPRIPNDALRDHLQGLGVTVVSDDGLVPRMRRYKDDAYEFPIKREVPATIKEQMQAMLRQYWGIKEQRRLTAETLSAQRG